MKGRYFLLIVALLLLLLVGPLFGPVAAYLVSVRDIQSAAAWEMVLFLITVSIAFGIVRIWMTRNGRTMADLGWGKPSRPRAIVLGTLLGGACLECPVFSISLDLGIQRNQFHCRADLW